jgi:hypothetical protein
VPDLVDTVELDGMRVAALRGERFSYPGTVDSFAQLHVEVAEPRDDAPVKVTLDYNVFEGEESDTSKPIFAGQVALEFQLEGEVGESEEWARGLLRSAWPHLYGALWSLTAEFRVPLRGVPLMLSDDALRLTVQYADEND